MIALIGAVTDYAGFVALITTILGGGGLAAFAAFRKAGPESESVSVSTMKEVIAELRTETSRLSAENAKLRASVTSLENVARENARLRTRLDALEERADEAAVTAAR